MGNARIAAFLVAALAGCAGASAQGPATDQHDRHGGHSGATLFVAALGATGKNETPAHGTGVFVVEPGSGRATVAYRLTYDGLRQGPAVIALRNFASGGVGATVHVLCGEGADPCPEASGATIEGAWTADPNLLRELAVERIYLAIDDRNGKTELRSQLATNPFMIHGQAFTAKLGSVGEAKGGSGTAAIFLVPLPNGDEQFAFALTVTGASSAVTRADVVGGRPGLELSAAPLAGASRQKLDARALRRTSATGGGFTGTKNLSRGKSGESAGGLMMVEGEELAVIVGTRKNPRGELAGVLTPVH